LILDDLQLKKIERKEFLGYPVDNVDAEDLVQVAKIAVLERRNDFIAVQNANKIYLSDKHPRLKQAISEAALILPENAMNIGMSLLGKPLKARNIGGVKAMEILLDLAEKESWSVFFLGTTKENIRKMVTRLRDSFRQLKIAGYRDGYFREEETKKIVEEIAASDSHLLFVGMGSPRQEFFITENLSKLNVNIALGVGGSFNIFAGVEKPAPDWTKYGMEWLYRTIQDPNKFKRYAIVNGYFLYKLARHSVLRGK
jgi:N-acetylglucosaminyldiphosphoundecaprenol N-acetyl-beta-D-mannosaminyltransferase